MFSRFLKLKCGRIVVDKKVLHDINRNSIFSRILKLQERENGPVSSRHCTINMKLLETREGGSIRCYGTFYILKSSIFSAPHMLVAEWLFVNFPKFCKFIKIAIAGHRH